MTDRTAIQERYMRDDLPVRLGVLAANLARIGSFSDHPDHRDVGERLLEESKFFVEWTAPAADLEAQTELVELQILLARWQRRWERIWAEPVERAAVAGQARKWSKRVLEISGLLR